MQFLLEPQCLDVVEQGLPPLELENTQIVEVLLSEMNEDLPVDELVAKGIGHIAEGMRSQAES